jgi:hypothetical protein
MHPEFFMTGMPAFAFKKIPWIPTNLRLLIGSHAAFATTPNQFNRTAGTLLGGEQDEIPQALPPSVACHVARVVMMVMNWTGILNIIFRRV